MNKEFILILAVIIILIVILYPQHENFDKNTKEFVGVGQTRYGLRGERQGLSDIAKLYKSPNRNIVFSSTMNTMWESDRSPPNEGIKGCTKTSCPVEYGEYDKYDTCWSCGSLNGYKIKIPDMNAQTGV